MIIDRPWDVARSQTQNPTRRQTVANTGREEISGAHDAQLPAVQPGQIVLMDMGAENVNGYTADVTRVLHVSGTFTTAQRDVYDILYASRCAGLADMAPGSRSATFT